MIPHDLKSSSENSYSFIIVPLSIAKVVFSTISMDFDQFFAFEIPDTKKPAASLTIGHMSTVWKNRKLITY